jgi:hypothetical protein
MQSDTLHLEGPVVFGRIYWAAPDGARLCLFYCQRRDSVPFLFRPGFIVAAGILLVSLKFSLYYIECNHPVVIGFESPQIAIFCSANLREMKRVAVPASKHDF